MKVYAGFWERTKAFAFDYIFILGYLIAMTALFLLLNALFGLIQWLFADRVWAQVSAFLVVTLPITLYFAIGESSVRQGTWGKQRLGLKVGDRNRNRVGLWRAFARTMLKFVPWELSHTLIWEIYFSGGSFPPMMTYGFALVYILIGLNIASLVMTNTNQAVYDLFAGTYIYVQQER